MTTGSSDETRVRDLSVVARLFEIYELQQLAQDPNSSTDPADLMATMLVDLLHYTDAMNLEDDEDPITGTVLVQEAMTTYERESPTLTGFYVDGEINLVALTGRP